jgi:hypothetical protein
MLGDRDRVLLAEVVRDDGRDSASRAVLVAFAPDLVLEIPRFRADATDAATHGNLLPIVQLAFVRKIDGGLNDSMTPVDRNVHHLRENIRSASSPPSECTRRYSRAASCRCPQTVY